MKKNNVIFVGLAIAGWVGLQLVAAAIVNYKN